jgi:HAE1 family hydrophobic/amphiphilic exporter-1
MTVWDLCIKRPVFTAMLVSVPVVLGLAAYRRLGVELFPNADVPVVTVTTTLRGASVEEMETGVTKPIEEAVNTVAGIEELRSTTREGQSVVTIQFVLEKNGPVAAQEVDAKVRGILTQLPQGTEPPIIDRFDLDAAPVMTIAVSGRRDFREVTEIARKRIKEDLETLPGVGAVILVGGRQRAVNVVIEPDRLLKYDKLTVEDVRQALVRENQEQPGGRVDRGRSELVLRTLGRLDKTADFRELIVTNRKNQMRQGDLGDLFLGKPRDTGDGQPVRVKDIGDVYDSYEEPRGLSRLWVRGRSMDDDPGENAVTLIVQKQSGSNTVAVVDSVKKRLGELQTSLPPDMKAEVIRDQSRFIKNSIEEVKLHLFLAALLVSGSILLFLRDWRTTLIATMAIPTSLVGTFAFMSVMGFTINNITMIGLILAVGIVVDDAVVVHENIFRHMEEYGLPARQAASAATREIALAVVATTMSLLVIFIPVAFMGGLVGRFFSSFGWVVAFSVLMSMFVSFTMTPVLCANFLKPLGGHGGHNGWIERLYITVLGWSLRHRWAVVLITLGILASTPFLGMIVGSDFVPKDDQSEFEVAITLPEGYSLSRADDVCSEIDGRLRKLRGVTTTNLVIGDTTGRVGKGQGDVTTASIYVRLIDLRERDYTQKQVMEEARRILLDYPDLRTAVQDVAVIQASGFKQAEIDLNLRGPDMDKLQAYSEEITAWMRQQGHFVDVDTSLSLRKPELRIRPQRERLSDLGVSIQDVSSTTNILVGGAPVSKYKEGAELYDVWLRAKRTGRHDREAIARMTVPSTKDPSGVVRLDSVAEIEPAYGPNTIERYQRQRQVVITANLKGKDLGGAVAEINEKLKSMNMPPEYRSEFLGNAKTMNETNENFLIAFGLAFLFMFMILAAQFESLVHPISILAALPLTVPCALLSLIFLRTPLDLYGVLGLFMLFGIVKKNGILQIDYTNQLRAKGMPRDQAILEANRTRLRPILMTTVMLVAAMVPMALGRGPGAGSRSSMAKVILGGQALSLLLTLLVTPVAYSLWDSLGRRIRGRKGDEPTAPEVPLAAPAEGVIVKEA